MSGYVYKYWPPEYSLWQPDVFREWEYERTIGSKIPTKQHRVGSASQTGGVFVYQPPWNINNTLKGPVKDR